jgi:hypothetical protein
MDMTCSVHGHDMFSAETWSKIYFIEYIVFGVNDILVSRVFFVSATTCPYRLRAPLLVVGDV